MTEVMPWLQSIQRFSFSTGRIQSSHLSSTGRSREGGAPGAAIATYVDSARNHAGSSLFVVGKPATVRKIVYQVQEESMFLSGKVRARLLALASLAGLVSGL